MDIAFPISIDLALKIGYVVLLVLFLLHTLVLSYHWFNYGTKRRTGAIALIVYILGGIVLFSMLGANIAFLI